jgi:hypothetical protein
VKSQCVVGTTEKLRKSRLQQILTAVHHLRCDAEVVALAVYSSHAANATGRAHENWQSAPWLVPPSSSQRYSPFRHLLPSTYPPTPSRHPIFRPTNHPLTLCSSPPSSLLSLSSSVWLLLHPRRRAACAWAPSPLARALLALLAVRGYGCLCRPSSDVSLPLSLPTTQRATLSCLHISRPTVSSLSPKLCRRTTLALTVKAAKDGLAALFSEWSAKVSTNGNVLAEVNVSISYTNIIHCVVAWLSSVNAQTGLAEIINMDRPLNINQSTPATGTAGSASQLLFSEENSQLLASMKGTPTDLDFIASWDIEADHSLSSRFMSIAPPTGGAVPFGMSIISGANAVLATDPAIVFDVIALSSNNASGAGAAAGSVTNVTGQTAIC